MSNSGFTGPQADDYDFAVGSVKGLRSWSIDTEGRLTGVTHRVVWTPGENVARCQDVGGKYEPCPAFVKAQAAVDYSDYRNTMLTYVYGGATCDEPTCVPGKGHFVASDEPRHAFDASCECGFWAYNEHDYQSHGAVTGIIEAYGKVTIGTRGFRAEKARIVAMSWYEPDAAGGVSASMWQRIQQLYLDVAYFDDRDDMVEAHPEVLKAWDAPGADFWDVEPPAPSRAAGGFTSGWSIPPSSLSRFMPPMLPSSGTFFVPSVANVTAATALTELKDATEITALIADTEDES